MSGTLGKAAQIKAKLVKSDYRCALSGEPLSVDSFAIDHIRPIAEGGTDESSNLQCVSAKINKAKGTMSNEEFVAMCVSVAAWSARGSATLLDETTQAKKAAIERAQRA